MLVLQALINDEPFTYEPNKYKRKRKLSPKNYSDFSDGLYIPLNKPQKQGVTHPQSHPILEFREGIRLRMWEWLKHLTANRKVAGSNPIIAIGDFLSPRS